MGLLDELAEQTAVVSVKCPIGSLLRTMEPAESKELQQALESEYPGTLITKVLKNRGHNISGRAVQTHRRKMCSCP